MQPIRLLKHNSRGSVLIVGLFTLALLSLLGSAATTTSRTDVSITGNAKTLQEAFYAAEVGLAMGEMKVDEEGHPLMYDETEDDWNWKMINWDDDSILMDDLDLPNTLDHLYERPRYLIKRDRLDPNDPRDKEKWKKFSQGTSVVSGYSRRPDPIFYDIYAKGTGGSSKT
ncbi:MAG: PilX N-terminal domain-containing pilus assembly protein, partial [Saprospiraceae bacterium]|nr:PilX N-terminal domain-containing pilus assembly protein [Saprospiraceae bacterium]